MKVSIRELARRLGVHKATVRKAVKAGRLELESDGTLDFQAAQSAWQENSQARASATNEQTSYSQARAANELLKAQTNRLKLKQLQGDLIDRYEAEAQVFMLARQERDSWQAWPSQIAGELAAELRVNQHKLQQLLEQQVRLHLQNLAKVELAIK